MSKDEKTTDVHSTATVRQEPRDPQAGGAPSSADDASAGAARKRAPRKAADRSDTSMSHISQSLQRVYQAAIDESVPDEMMDLLKRLD